MCIRDRLILAFAPTLALDEDPATLCGVVVDNRLTSAYRADVYKRQPVW